MKYRQAEVDSLAMVCLIILSMCARGQAGTSQARDRVKVPRERRLRSNVEGSCGSGDVICIRR